MWEQGYVKINYQENDKRIDISYRTQLSDNILIIYTKTILYMLIKIFSRFQYTSNILYEQTKITDIMDNIEILCFNIATTRGFPYLRADKALVVLALSLFSRANPSRRATNLVYLYI